MVRGCQKQIYYVKDTRSALFAEAYFVLKRAGNPGNTEAELAAEAQRIVSEMDSIRKTKRMQSNGSWQKLGAFVVGAASSSAVIGGIALLLAFA